MWDTIKSLFTSGASGIWSFASSYIEKFFIYFILVCLGVSLIFNGFQKLDNDHLNATIAADATKVSTLEANLATAQAAVKDQNTKIQQAADKAKKDVEDQMNTLKGQLADQTKKNDDLIKQLQKQPAPKTCDDVKTYLKSNLDLYQW
jgi:cell division protein FtsB